jgi:hypothetical protein
VRPLRLDSVPVPLMLPPPWRRQPAPCDHARAVAIYEDLVRRVAAMGVQLGASAELLAAADALIDTYRSVAEDVPARRTQPPAAVIAYLPREAEPDELLRGRVLAQLQMTAGGVWVHDLKAAVGIPRGGLMASHQAFNRVIRALLAEGLVAHWHSNTRRGYTRRRERLAS